MDDRIQYLIDRSSSVERIEEHDGYRWISFYPRRQVLPENIIVLNEPIIYSKGTSPRFLNGKHNILFFADESHRVQFLRRMKFSSEWIDKNLTFNKCEIIPFPQREQQEQEFQLVCEATL